MEIPGRTIPHTGALPSFSTVLTLLGISRLMETLRSICINSHSSNFDWGFVTSICNVGNNWYSKTTVTSLYVHGAALGKIRASFQAGYTPIPYSPYAKGKGRLSIKSLLCAPDCAVLLYVVPGGRVIIPVRCLQGPEGNFFFYKSPIQELHWCHSSAVPHAHRAYWVGGREPLMALLTGNGIWGIWGCWSGA